LKKYVIAFIIFMFICPFLCTKIIYGAESNEDLSAKVEAMEKMLIELRGQLKQQAETYKTEQKEELQALIRDEVRGLVPGEDYWTEKA
jgi:large-conductance mechanosensitive channel